MVLTMGTSAIAQDKTAEVDRLLSWTTADMPGCVCAVAQNKQVIMNRVLTVRLEHSPERP
ncbi:hypothetical protein [Paraflavitalea speifideaquila]|uniref:hypothetical protein n=1 Tax=Paraflavitalea speifideaquila TaxID=3076558 RepID=UPI0028EE99D1|nr:hypothetical protein [Paraflavitalea speifideiaquila]